MTSGRARVVEAGERVGQLTVLVRRMPGAMVECQCDCGNRHSVSLRKWGTTISCGCHQRRRASDSNRTHGMTGTPIHVLWKGMIARCGQPGHVGWPNYGGRGITVCDTWRDFANFYADMGGRPAGHTLDRIDNDGPYSPENCRWATRVEQRGNRRPAEPKPACGRGHEYTEANTYLNPGGGRRCRACMHQWKLGSRARGSEAQTERAA